MDARVVEDFRQLWLGLDRVHRPTLEALTRGSGRAKTLYDEALTRFSELGCRKVDKLELEKLLPSGDKLSTDFKKKDAVLFLRPTGKGDLMLPVVSLKCVLGNGRPEVRIRVGLCQLTKE